MHVYKVLDQYIHILMWGTGNAPLIVIHDLQYMYVRQQSITAARSQSPRLDQCVLTPIGGTTDISTVCQHSRVSVVSPGYVLSIIVYRG